MQDYKYVHIVVQTLGFPGGSDGKESACNAGDRFELQFLKWDFSWDAVAAQGYILRWRGNHVVFLEV